MQTTKDVSELKVGDVLDAAAMGARAWGYTTARVVAIAPAKRSVSRSGTVKHEGFSVQVAIPRQRGEGAAEVLRSVRVRLGTKLPIAEAP